MVSGRLRAVMIASSLLLAAASTPTGGDCATDADPVDLFTGLNIRDRDDIVVPGEPKIELHRAFGSRWSFSRAFGIGTSHSYDVFLAGTVLFELIYAYQTTQLPSLERMTGRWNAEYTYDEQHRLRRVKEAGLELDHEYDAGGRVIRQDVKGWGSWTFTYTLGADGKATQTDVVNPDGLHRRVVFNGDGYPQSDATFVGRPEERVTSYERAAGGNLVARITVECRSVSGAPVSVTAPVEREPAYAVEERLQVQCEQQREAASRR
jgi:hypothetical protein